MAVPLAAVAQSLWLPALAAIVWQTASSLQWINPFFFPPPSKALATAGLMGINTASRRALEPIVSGLYSTPKPTLPPLLMLLLGLGDAPKVTLIALVGFIFLSSQTLDAIRGVKHGYAEMATNYGADHWALIRPDGAKVLMPASIERSVWECFSGKAEQRGVDLPELPTEVLKRGIGIN